MYLTRDGHSEHSRLSASLQNFPKIRQVLFCMSSINASNQGYCYALFCIGSSALSLGPLGYSRLAGAGSSEQLGGLEAALCGGKQQ